MINQGIDICGTISLKIHINISSGEGKILWQQDIIELF